MTAKEYLSRIQEAETKINQKIDQRRELLEQATSITISFGTDKVQTSSQHDRMGNLVAKTVDLEQEIQETVIAFWDDKDKIINQIQVLDNVKYLDVLFKRYIEYKQMDIISREMGLSYAYTIELHKKALKEFEKVHTDLL